jgi:hypothetical protein
MKAKIIKIIWGVVLISLGTLLLAAALGYVSLDRLTDREGTLIFALLSAAFFFSYFFSGIRHWGWLFPALIFAALALTISPIMNSESSAIIALPFLLSIAIPFYVGYFLNRTQWGLLIPAWALTVLPIVPLLSDLINPDLLAALVLYSVAIPFLVAYLVDQRSRWALITAATLGFIGIFPLLDTFTHGDLLGPVVMLLIALPFFLTGVLSRRHWWAFIPSGIFASIGMVALLDILLPGYEYVIVGGYQFGVYTSLLFLGFASTCGILWQLRFTQPTDWARYPAIGLLAVSLLAFLLGENFSNFLLAVALLTVGVVMLSTGLLKRGKTHQPSS